ncbi:hypothetical protein MCHI_000537 [Candidatus Magnetoovum chiemensis]|nr:hypothetical protein MCHI_000537 [Candidatus Magnetoovum chiemensis]
MGCPNNDVAESRNPSESEAIFDLHCLVLLYQELRRNPSESEAIFDSSSENPCCVRLKKGVSENLSTLR